MAKCIVYKELNYVIKFIGFLSTEVCLLIVKHIFEGLNVWTLSLGWTRSFLSKNWRNLDTREILKFVVQSFVEILIWDILISDFRDVFESSELIMRRISSVNSQAPDQKSNPKRPIGRIRSFRWKRPLRLSRLPPTLLQVLKIIKWLLNP